MFKKKEQSKRILDMISKDGRGYVIEQPGHLNTTKHETVLQLLERRAERLRKDKDVLADNVHNWSVDETGTVDTPHLLSSREVEQQEKLDMTGVSDEILRVHGVMPGTKPDGVVRLMYENVNSLSNRLGGNQKLEKAKDLIHEWGADIVGMVEHRQNLQHKNINNGWNKLFLRGEEEVRSVVAHNVHENVAPVQEGGVGLLIFGPAIESIDMAQSGKDESGLGRWVTMTLQGDGIKTRIVCGYNPCKSTHTTNKPSSTSYAQQRRYLINKRKDTTTCPRVAFREELISQLKKWRTEGDRIILCMDANDHIYRGILGRELSEENGLGMKEVIRDFTGAELGPTYFRGSKPIDGIWATPDVQISNACVMPAGYGIGDHRLFIVDIVAASLIGEDPPRIQRPAARRLNTRLPHVAERYAANYERNVIRHRLIEKLAEAHQVERDENKSKAMIETVDHDSGQYMAHAEKKCRRFKSGRICFSPESVIWIKRKQVYESLLEYRRGKRKNNGNLKRLARKQQIRRPFSLTIEEIMVRMDVCEKQTAYFRKNGHRYRKKHLLHRVEVARKAGKEEAVRQILNIIEREKQKAFWGRMKHACGKKKGGSPTSVQVEGPMDTIVEHSTQESMHTAIWDNIHHKRFHLAEDAPICQGELRGNFGYNATSPTAQAVLDGTYQYPDDFDEATRELCEECAKIRLNIPKDSIRTNINKNEWRGHWRKVDENTSSSFSGRHMGNYKAGRHSDHISHFQAVLASLIFHRGMVLERWATGLSVMLQKIFGCSLVSKLRSILLMEADFNAANKIIFGTRMLQNVRKYELMPGEIYSERGRTADDGTLAKVLVFDIARQFKISTGVASVDADNCFDRVAHAMASMVFQALGIPSAASVAMLSTIQEMKFFLRTGFGDSKEFARSSIEIRTQGLCQGNGASPAAWAVVSIVIIRAHKEKGHGAQFLCPISNLKCHIAGVLFVDDTDLIHIKMDENEQADETLFNLQESITNWGKLLLATGGALKPSKCFYYLISFEWRPDGTWKYAANEKNPEFQLEVPLADGSMAGIVHYGVNHSSKTLGSMTCPSGSGEGAIRFMQTKSLDWASTVKEAKLSRRNVWFMMRVQFWPRVAYGLCNNTSSFEELAECLMKPYGEIQRLGGFRLSVRRDLRLLDIGFYGIGCPHPAIECGIAQISKLLMHTGCKSDLSIQLQVSLEAFIIELGVSCQPFLEDYTTCNKWVTHSWIKTVWEKAHCLSIKIELRESTNLLPPRGDNDYWIMKELQQFCNTEELVRLNRVRIHQHVIFGSDIMGASGRSIDKKYLTERPWEEKWSTIKFPNERPPSRDFKLWRDKIPQLRHSGHLQMGNYEMQGHKIWDWTYSPDEGRLYNWTGENTADVYGPSISTGLTTRANAWGRRRCDQQLNRSGEYCTVEQIGAFRNYKMISYSPAPPPEAEPVSFWDILEKWGCTWLWDSVKMVGEDTWLAEAINDNTLLAVTDGSFMSKMYPNMNSCAFIMECTQGRGKLVGSFPEKSRSAGAYRGELLGLLSIHLILLAVDIVHTELSGSAHIHSDCLGALNQVHNLPTDRIPARCKQSDILKIIMIHCRKLQFRLRYSHVEAHQDDDHAYGDLSRPSQLNCACDLAAKMVLYDLSPLNLPRQRRLPLEPVCVWVDNDKITTDSLDRLRYWAQQRIAREVFSSAGILSYAQFDKVDWESVHAALHSVPRMFQVFASKQVFNNGGTNMWLARFDKSGKKSNKCPSCFEAVETAAHIVNCCHTGRVDALLLTIKLADKWMKSVNTDPAIRECIYHFLMERGETKMIEVCDNMGYGVKYRKMAKTQDEIGWRRFLEGMICSEFQRIQHTYYLTSGLRKTGKWWAQQLVIKLLEITHGQWLYRNIQVHDKVTGLHATTRKEEIQMEIEVQQEIGFEGFLEEDAYLGECNLGDLEYTSGTDEQYWLLAVKAAREAAVIEDRSRRAATTVGTTT